MRTGAARGGRKGKVGGTARGSGPTEGASQALLARLSSLQLIVVTGKGGVGKSVLSAALGRLLAARGRQTLLMEVDPRENLHHMLDVEPSAGEVVDAGPNLQLQNVRPRAVMDELVRERLRLDVLSRRVLASPVYEHFAEGAPGLKETAVLGHAMRILAGHSRGSRRPDTVVLDAPATGHGVGMLVAPQLVSEVVSSGPVGRLATEISGLVVDTERCGFVIVTTAEEMPVQEALDLIEVLDSRLGRRPEAVLVNGLYPPLPPDWAGKKSADEPLWALRRRVNEEELPRLRAAWSGPLPELPLLPLDRGPELVAALGTRLKRALRTEE